MPQYIAIASLFFSETAKQLEQVAKNMGTKQLSAQCIQSKAIKLCPKNRLATRHHIRYLLLMQQSQKTRFNAMQNFPPLEKFRATY